MEFRRVLFRSIAQNVSSMGADGYRVQRIVMMGFDPKKYMEMLRRNPQLSREEYEFLRQRLTMTKEIGINAGRGVTVHRGTEVSEGVGLQGASPNIGVITNLEAAEGRFLSEIENDRHMNGAFIGNDLKEKVFGRTGPIGPALAAAGVQFDVVGVSKVKGSEFGQSRDNFLMVPIKRNLEIWGAAMGEG